MFVQFLFLSLCCYTYVTDDGVEVGIPVMYREDASLSTEIVTHSNRVFSCMDHNGSSQVCKYAAEHPCQCEENEAYMFSFCRKTCRYCKPDADGSYSIWRLRAISEFEPTWNIVELDLYSQYTDEQGMVRLGDENISIPVTGKPISSSSYRGLKPENAFDGNNETWWSPDGYGSHSLNLDWVGFMFRNNIKVRGVKITMWKPENEEKYSAPSVVAVEGANSLQGPFYEVWRSKIDREQTTQMLVKRRCKVLWREYYVNDDFECFRLFTSYQTWNEAVDYCKSEGGHLAHVLNANETAFIMNDIRLCGSTWIGLNDIKTEGTYVWANGMKLENYTNWNYDQTDDSLQLDKEDCVFADHRAQWNFAHCDNKYYFVCRRKPDDLPDVVVDVNNPNLDAPVIFFADDLSSFTLNDTAHRVSSDKHFAEKERIQSSDSSTDHVEYPQLPKKFNKELNNDKDNSPSENPKLLSSQSGAEMTTAASDMTSSMDTQDIDEMKHMYKDAMRNNYKKIGKGKKSLSREKTYKNIKKKKELS